MDFLRDWQQAIVGISGGLLMISMSLLAFFYRSITTRQNEHERRVSAVLDDHEQRIRRSVARSDWEDLVSEVRELNTHYTQTRLEFHAALMETERRLSDKIDAAFVRRSER